MSLKMELGIIGLGKMGANIALNGVEKGIKIVGKARKQKPELTQKGVLVVEDYAKFLANLKPPRSIFLSLPAGPTVDKVLKELIPHLDKGDVILDEGNSYYKDSIRREEEISKQGLYFVDCGTSGGTDGARHGACFMVGGRPEAVKICEPILRVLAVEGGYLYTGKAGSGHFVKLVHNGIEFGMLQSIGEGVELLQHSDLGLNVRDIFGVWSHGSVIRGWLVELMEKGLGDFKDIKEVPDYIEDTGEVNWLVHEGIEKEIPLPVITQSVIELFRSRNKDSDAARAIAIIRHGFGGHPYGKSEYIANERRLSRIHPI
ncbi:MAG: 6-phosphogluconate dehydrogenase [Thermodesulfobacteriota bacterium]|nr:6-phosphogluconate dehydrogenase [Thermodesulfobacteriota bacterium]